MTVNRSESGILAYFISTRSAVGGIQSGLWPRHTMSRPTLSLASRSATNGSLTSKGFVLSFITEQEFFSWYINPNTTEKMNTLSTSK